MIKLYADTANVMLLRPVRRYLKLLLKDMIRDLHLSNLMLSTRERLLLRMPLGTYIKCERYYLDAALKRGLLSEKQYKYVLSLPVSKSLREAVRMLRWNMTETELAVWRRDWLQITNAEIGKLIGYDDSVVSKVLLGYDYYPDTTEKVRLCLLRLETQRLREIYR